MNFHSYKTQNISPFPTIFLFFLSIFLFESQLYSQEKNTRQRWTTSNPFRTNVFVENFGQFDNWITASDSIKYTINNSDKIFFLPNGIIYRLDYIEKENEQETTSLKNKPEKEFTSKIHPYYVKMLWEGCNANTKIETNEESQGYYTFGEEGCKNVKAKGYKKITYKDLYPGIDIEYTIPEKGGVKYKLIVHPGADLGSVKMNYSGDVENIFIDSIGNINIKTPAGNIIDHAPLASIENSDLAIISKFSVKNYTVQFDIPSQNNFNQVLIIDPWTTVPTTLTTDNAAYDIDFDNQGNVYVSGGSPPHKLAKYSSSGNLLWTFTNPASWAPTYNGYSKFCLIPQSGTVFIGEGWNGSGPRIMKINSGGLLVTTSLNYVGSEEIWVMFYNRCNNQICGFGGGTQTPNNIQQVTDTNLTTSNVSCFNGYPAPGNDIASVKMDYNGDFYALAPSTLYGVSGPNSLTKSLISTNYSPPCFFDVSTGYSFAEGQNYGIPGFLYPNCFTNRANALALNTDYIYSYDGNSLKAWNKINGTFLNSIIVDPSYSGGQNRIHEGIAVDDCNNIYVGGTQKVHEYSFDGSAFTPITVYTANIPNEVYDINIDKTFDNLYVCGFGFVTTFPVTSCPVNQLSISTSVDSCINSATVTVNNGTPPYTFIWSNGATTSTISGIPPGTYTVTVIDNSCILQNGIDTVVINSPYNMYISNDTTICFGSSVVLYAQGANSYIWSPSTGLSSITDSVVTATPINTITYTVAGTFPNGCTGSLSVTVNVTSAQNINVSNDTTICFGDSAFLQVNGGTSYTWSPSGTLNDATIPNPVANPASTTTYYVTVTNPPCLTAVIDSIKVTVNPVPVITISNDTSICVGNNLQLLASGGSSYSWSPAYSLNNGNISNPIANPNSSTMYYVTVSDGTCDNTDSVMVSVFPNPIVSISNDATICNGDSIMLFVSGGNNYEWSPSSTLSNYQISNPYAFPSATMTYTVTVTLAPCSESESVTITVIDIYPSISNDTSICQGETAFLNAQGGSNYFWTPSAGINNQSSPSPIATPDSTIIYYVSISENGCMKMDSVIITVNDCSLLIPNVFTPNTDGVNDFFEIIYGGDEPYHLIIFNRWGRVMFTSDYKNILWDGKSPNGSIASDGVYFYILNVGSKSYHGFVTLIR